MKGMKDDEGDAVVVSGHGEHALAACLSLSATLPVVKTTTVA